MPSDELFSNPVKVTVHGQDFVMYRDTSGRPRAFYAYCPHRGCDLSIGSFHDNQLVCPFHGWRFNAIGKCTHIPANRAGAPIPPKAQLSVYPACDRAGLVWIYTHAADLAGQGQSSTAGNSPSLGTAGGAAGENLTFETFPELEGSEWTRVPFQSTWNAHFSRVVESVLDVSHLPFVHPETTGTDVDPTVFGPDYSVTPHSITIHPTPFAPSHPMQPTTAAPGMENQTEIQLLFPNQWMIRTPTGENTWMCTFLTFTPVDESATKIFGLAMRNFELDSELLDIFHVNHTEFVMNQDKEVIQRLRPMAAPPLGQEAHVPSDGPTIRFRAMLFDALEAEARAMKAVDGGVSAGGVPAKGPSAGGVSAKGPPAGGLSAGGTRGHEVRRESVDKEPSDRESSGGESPDRGKEG